MAFWKGGVTIDTFAHNKSGIACQGQSRRPWFITKSRCLSQKPPPPPPAAEAATNLSHRVLLGSSRVLHDVALRHQQQQQPLALKHSLPLRFAVCLL
jgi:hypothetical protein